MVTKTLTGGDKLKARLDEIAQNLGRPGTLQVGFLENATYPDGTSVPMVAAIQEYGAPKVGIPPRPFMRTTVAERAPSWGKTLAKILAASDYNTARSLALMGEIIKGQIQRKITDIFEPALSPVTLMLRQMRIGKVNEKVTFAMVQEARRRVAAGQTATGVSTKPLVDSGHLLNSVDYQVVIGGQAQSSGSTS